MTQTIIFIAETNLLVRALSLGFLSFVLSMLLTPLYTSVAYKWKWWKQQREDAWSGGEATVYKKLHAKKHRRNIPTMAGIIFVSSTVLVTVFGNLERSQTWLPLAGMVGSAAIGFVDDWINIRACLSKRQPGLGSGCGGYSRFQSRAG